MASVTQYLAKDAATLQAQVWDQKHKGTNGAAHVADVGRAAQSHNRYLSVVGNALATDVATATWTEAEGVYSIRIKVDATTAGNLVRFVFDATPVDDATDLVQAKTWLTPVAAAVTQATDVEYFEARGYAALAAEVGPVGVSEWSEWFQFSSPLRRLDIIAVDIDEQVNVFIEVA